MNFSSYSSFFTSGLLSEPCCSSSTSRSPSPVLEEYLGPRRGSLPNDAPPSLCGPSHKIHSSDESSAFYFTLQPRRDSAALRSFLSLDLAESQSIRSARIRRRNSTITKSSMSSRDRMPPPSLPLSPSGTRGPYISTPSPLRPAIRRASRDLPRPLPSPKPVPSTSPPDVPLAKKDLPPVLPPIRSSIRFSFDLPGLQATITSTTSHDTTSLPLPLPPSQYCAPPKSPCDRSISSITSAERRGSREDALAYLEGRAENAHRDFMDMSDDDDNMHLATAIGEDEDEFIASCSPHNKSLSSQSSTRTRHRKSAKESWFPLVSFIDLKDDDFSSWNWRNFIEVGGAS